MHFHSIHQKKKYYNSIKKHWKDTFQQIIYVPFYLQ